MSNLEESQAARAACPVCAGKTSPLGIGRGAHPLRQCAACGHRVADATPSQLERLYGAGYDGFRADPTFEASARSFFAEEILPRLDEAERPARMLDVGCGNGTVLRVARELGLSASGVDVSEAAVEHCRQLGFDAARMPFEGADLGEEAFDLVSFWDVVEHLIHPASLVHAAARSLRDGGWLLVKVPHHRWLSVGVAAWLPRLSSPILQTPAHLQFFTRRSLELLLGKDFDQLAWVQVRAMRAPAAGGRLRRRIARAVVRRIQAASGDGTLALLARRRAR